MDYQKTAREILDLVGGSQNIVSAAHCATRLRLVISDNSKADREALENVDGVKGVFEASGQLQIILGTGTVNKVFDEFDKEVGFNYLRGMHLNDSKKALGTHVDRHDSIGKGLIGKAFFERLMQDSRFDNIPLILETPDESKWKEEIAWLRSME